MSIKFGTKQHWVKGIKVDSNEGPCLFPRGENNKIVKIIYRYLKVFFLRIIGPISHKLGTKPPWMMEIQVCSNEGPHSFPREIIAT